MATLALNTLIGDQLTYNNIFVITDNQKKLFKEDNEMARTNYQFEKRKKELAKIKKKEEKRQRKLDKNAETKENSDQSPDEGESI